MSSFTYEVFPLEVVRWFQEPNDHKFLGILQTQRGLTYGLHISTYNIKEPDVYYFEVMILKVTDTATGEKSFDAETRSKFKITLAKNIIPEVKLYFTFIEVATKQFVNEFNERTKNTRFYFDRIAVPQIEQMRVQIQQYLDMWDKDLRHVALN